MVTPPTKLMAHSPPCTHLPGQRLYSAILADRHAAVLRMVFYHYGVAVVFSVKLTSSFTPLPCGPFLSARPIMEPCRQIAASCRALNRVGAVLTAAATLPAVPLAL